MEGDQLLNKNKTILLLYSGGLDSYLLYKLWESEYPSHNLICLNYNLGQEYADKELHSIHKLIQSGEVDGNKFVFKNIDWLDDSSTLIGKENSLSGNIIIPGRNAVLATLAACNYLPDEIWMGALKGEDHEKSTDKNETFRTLINSQLQYVLQKNIEVRFPFIERKMGKYEIVDWALNDLKIPLETLTSTSSCLSGESGNCGKCVVCFRRWGIFYSLTGMTENYNVHPMADINNLKMLYAMVKYELQLDKSCHYDEYRRREIIPGALRYFSTTSLRTVLDNIYPIIDRHEHCKA